MTSVSLASRYVVTEIEQERNVGSREADLGRSSFDRWSFGERRTKKGYIVYLKSTVELHARKTAKPVAPPNMRQPPEEFRDV